MMWVVRALLRLAGKGDSKVAAVFGFRQGNCHRAVAHVRAGAPGIPVWLFSTVEPGLETRALCEKVFVHRRSLPLVWKAQRLLWPRWAAIAVTSWTGEHGKWPLKLAPFLTPPCRALILNENGDFLAGTPAGIARHAARRVRDTLHSGTNRARDIGKIFSYHIWRSAPVMRVRNRAAGTWLWLESVAIRTAVFSRPRLALIFRRRNARQFLDLAVPHSEGEGILVFRQNGAGWSPWNLEEAARASDARWLLWLEHGASPSAAADLVPLFSDPRTFAASRQLHFRAWKPMLFATAPFRTLQSGEASRVLAPVSDSILVDRRKLLALGIPRCPLAGSAWKVIFWKAAAAGWRAYSVGQSGTRDEQPDLPIVETGFLLHVLRRPSLRRLAPQQPALAQGNIALPAAGPPPGPRGGNIRVLLVSPYLPFPLSHGGAVRIFSLCRALAGRVEFALVSLREKEDVSDYARLGEIFGEIRIVDKDERPTAGERLPEQVRQHQLSGLGAAVAELAREWEPDLLQVEYTHLAAFRDAAPHVPAILVEHDITFSLYHQLAAREPVDSHAWREYERWLEFEREWLEKYDGVWTVSDHDRAIAIREGRRAPEQTFTVPNGVDTARFVPRGEPAGPPEIFYVGSFRHLPNVIGFEKLRDEVMPRVWAVHPEARLRVVAGPRHEEYWKQFAPRGANPEFDPRVTVHGFVEDLRPLYAGATLVVVPLEVSAGTNIKVLEAMACGKAIVTTPVGCAGLDLRTPEEVLIEKDWQAFARAVAALLDDRSLRERLGRRARRTAERRFSWEAIAAAAHQSYQMLAGTRERIGIPWQNHDTTIRIPGQYRAGARILSPRRVSGGRRQA